MGSAQCVTLWYPPNLNPTCCELICTQCLDFQLETALNIDHGSDTLPFSPSRKEVDAADKYYLYTKVYQLGIWNAEVSAFLRALCQVMEII